jgi:hypothetical protein
MPPFDDDEPTNVDLLAQAPMQDLVRDSSRLVATCFGRSTPAIPARALHSPRVTQEVHAHEADDRRDSRRARPDRRPR